MRQSVVTAAASAVVLLAAAVLAQVPPKVSDDDNPNFYPSNPVDCVTKGGLAELHYFPQGQDGRWVLTALYNRVDPEENIPSMVQESASLTVNHAFARNIRMSAEVARDFELDQTRVSLGVIAAF